MRSSYRWSLAAVAAAAMVSGPALALDPFTDTTPMTFDVEIFVAQPAFDVFFEGADNDVDVDSLSPGATRTINLKFILSTPGGQTDASITAEHAFQGGQRGFINFKHVVLPVSSSEFATQAEIQAREPTAYGYTPRIGDTYTRNQFGAYNNGASYTMIDIPATTADSPSNPAGLYGPASAPQVIQIGSNIGDDPGTLINTVGLVPVDVISDGAASVGSRSHSIRWTASFPGP